MVIDKVENCAIKYHFNGPDPISWKSCCTAARLDRSLDWETWWWPLTTVYGSPLTWSRVWNNWDSGMIYLRYTYSWCNGEFSPVISYNMPDHIMGQSREVSSPWTDFYYLYFHFANGHHPLLG